MLDVAIYERQTPLTVNNAEYEKRCGSGSPPDHVCFTFLAGDASNVDVSITKGEFAYPATDVLVKDDAYHGKHPPLSKQPCFQDTDLRALCGG